MADSDPKACEASQGDEASVDTVSTCSGIMKGRHQADQPDGHETDPLQDAQWAGFVHQHELKVQRDCNKGAAGDKSERVQNLV